MTFSGCRCWTPEINQSSASWSHIKYVLTRNFGEFRIHSSSNKGQQVGSMQHGAQSNTADLLMVWTHTHVHTSALVSKVMYRTENVFQNTPYPGVLSPSKALHYKSWLRSPSRSRSSLVIKTQRHWTECFWTTPSTRTRGIILSTGVQTGLFNHLKVIVDLGCFILQLLLSTTIRLKTLFRNLHQTKVNKENVLLMHCCLPRQVVTCLQFIQSFVQIYCNDTNWPQETVLEREQGVEILICLPFKRGN